jgi:uncharacterized membrane protein/thiol-disulfide isomerase/thioredoxin
VIVKRLILILIALVVCLSLIPGTARAQEENPVVYVVLFYSPYCGHCHAFITEDIPVLQEMYGDQVAIIGVDTSQENGNQLFYATYEYFGLPTDRAGVPTFVCGDEVLIGRRTDELITLIEAGLEAGGVYINVPFLREAYEQAMAEQGQVPGSEPAPSGAETEQEPVETAASETPEAAEEAPAEATASEIPEVAEEAPAAPAETEAGEAAAEEEAVEPEGESAQGNPGGVAPMAVGGEIEEASLPPDTLANRLARDPVGNALSVVILMGLAATLIAGAAPGVRGSINPTAAPRLGWLEAFPQWLSILITSIAGTIIAATLVLHAGGDARSTPLAVVTLLGMASVVAIALLAWINREPDEPSSLPDWLILVVIVAGLAAAIYLATIEVGQEEAFCGAVGDCNTVNQSGFALIFGVLPVGVLGVIGYAAILLAWIVGKASKGRLADLAWAALLGMALFGVAFSTYLTFLEPFIIGATCAWCLTSALAMIMILWLTAAPGWRAFLRLLGRPIT